MTVPPMVAPTPKQCCNAIEVLPMIAWVYARAATITVLELGFTDRSN